MAYGKSKTCGRKHPTRNLRCWEKNCDLSDQHWAYLTTPTGLTKITWRLYEEPKDE